MTRIIELSWHDECYVEPIARLLALLTSSSVRFGEEEFRQMMEDTHSHLFLLLHDDAVAGMLTVGTYYSPTGGKAWIEDVVVDNPFRGCGYGKLLVEHAISFVKSKSIPLLMLTSNPRRVVANGLYRSLGFERKETNVYRMRFE